MGGENSTFLIETSAADDSIATPEEVKKDQKEEKKENKNDEKEQKKKEKEQKKEEKKEAREEKRKEKKQKKEAKKEAKEAKEGKGENSTFLIETSAADDSIATPEEVKKDQKEEK